MRDLQAYQSNYENLPFEATQVQYRKRKINEIVTSLKPQSILEVGCGEAAFFNDCDAYTQFTVIEPAEQFYQKAKQEAASDERVKVVLGTVQAQVDLLQAQAYDLILMTSLLHEIEDSASLLQTIKTLCDSQTVVHINVPNAKSFHRLLALEMGLIDSIYTQSAVQKTMQQAHTFDLDALTELVKQCGFKVLDSGSFFVKPFTHQQMSSLQAQGFLTQQMLDGLYGLSQHLPDNGSEIFVNIQKG